MTDKQIIIDGVDVSGCCYYADGKCTNSHMIQSNCKNVAVCYYKQLKRAEAQCEDMFVKHTDLEMKYKQKEQEYEELKEKIENYCYDCDVAERMAKVTYAATGGRLSYSNYTLEAIEQAYNDQLRIDVEYRTKELQEQLDSVVREWEEYTEKYKQTLAEIKEIVSSTLDCGEWVSEGDNKMEAILNKINEVLDE